MSTKEMIDEQTKKKKKTKIQKILNILKFIVVVH